MISKGKWMELGMYYGIKASMFPIRETYEYARVEADVYTNSTIIIIMWHLNDITLCRMKHNLEQLGFAVSISELSEQIKVYCKKKSFLEMPLDMLSDHVS